MPAKYVGKLMEIIYLASSGELTQRHIRIVSIRDGLIKATCQDGKWRTFRADNILSWQLAK